MTDWKESLLKIHNFMMRSFERQKKSWPWIWCFISSFSILTQNNKNKLYIAVKYWCWWRRRRRDASKAKPKDKPQTLEFHIFSNGLTVFLSFQTFFLYIWCDVTLLLFQNSVSQTPYPHYLSFWLMFNFGIIIMLWKD
jgi:hypothetical protein